MALPGQQRLSTDNPIPWLLYTPSEAAEALGISLSSLYVLISQEAIDSVRIAGSRRLTVAALSAFIEALSGENSVVGR